MGYIKKLAKSLAGGFLAGCKNLRFSIFIFSFVLTILLMLFLYSWPSAGIFQGIFNFVGTFVFYYLLIVLIFFLIINYNVIVSDKKVSRWWILLYGLPFVLVSAVYLLGFFPAIMTYDSLDQWKQVMGSRLNDWHPVTHTLFLWLITRIWLSPTAIAITQIIIGALVFGYCAYSLEKSGINKVLLFIMIFLVSFNIVNNMMAVTLWKDILYSYSILLFTAIVINLLISKGKWITYKLNILLFVITSLGVVFFRHNGEFCFIPVAILLVLFFRQYFIRISIASLVVIVVFVIVTGPVYKALNVVPAFKGESYSVPLNVAGAVIANGGYLTDDQKAYALSLMPMDVWKATYKPYVADPLKNKVDYKVMLNDQGKFLKFVADISLQNPQLAIKSYAQLTSIAWYIPQMDYAYTYTDATDIIKNDQGLVSAPVDSKLNNTLIWLFNISVSSSWLWLFWRPALALFLVLLFSAVSVYKNGWKFIILPMMSLLNVVTVLAGIPAQDFRYLYSIVLVALPVMLFSLVKIPPSPGIKSDDDKPLNIE